MAVSDTWREHLLAHGMSPVVTGQVGRSALRTAPSLMRKRATRGGPEESEKLRFDWYNYINLKELKEAYLACIP